MKYLIKYKLHENLTQAKKFLKENDIPESDNSYQELKTLLNRNIGYLAWFVKMHFSESVLLSELKSFYNDIIKGEHEVISKLPKTLIEYTDWENLMDDIQDTRDNINIKRLLDEFPSSQKKLISSYTTKSYGSIRDNLIKLYNRKDKNNFIKKISRYHSASELINAINMFANSQSNVNYDSTKKAVVSSGAKIIFDSKENDIIIVEVNYKQLINLASNTSWCIKSESTFNNYSDDINNQYIIFLTDTNDNYAKIGVTVGLKYRTAHAVNDSYVSESQLIDILTTRGFEFDNLKVPKEDVIRNGRVRDLLGRNYDITKEDIFKYKFKYTDDDLKNFTEKEIEDNNLLDKKEISRIGFHREERTFDYLMSNYKRLGFKLTYSDLIHVNPTNEQVKEIEKRDDILSDEALDKVNALIYNSKIPLQVIKRSCKYLLHVYFTLKYCKVTSKDYELKDIIENIKVEDTTIYEDTHLSEINILSKYLLENGYEKELESPELCKELVSKINLSFSQTRLRLLIAFSKYFKGAKKAVEDFISPDSNNSQRDIRYHNTHSLRDSLLKLYDRDIDVLKKEFPDYIDYVISEKDTATALKDIEAITPSGRIMGQGLFIAHAQEYMKRKGRRGMIITPQEYYDDFFDVLKNETWNSYSINDRICLYMMMALVKLGKINEISKMKIIWGYEFTENVVKYLLSNATYDSMIGAIGPIRQDYSKFAEAFLLTNSESEQLLNYLLAHVRENIVNKVVNSKYADEELEKYKVFSLVYYIKDWGFRNYLRLVEKHKYKGRKENHDDGKYSVIEDRTRIEYLSDILKYLSYKRLKDDFEDLAEQIMGWELGKREYKDCVEKLNNYRKELNRTTRY